MLCVSPAWRRQEAMGHPGRASETQQNALQSRSCAPKTTRCSCQQLRPVYLLQRAALVASLDRGPREHPPPPPSPLAGTGVCQQRNDRLPARRRGDLQEAAVPVTGSAMRASRSCCAGWCPQRAVAPGAQSQTGPRTWKNRESKYATQTRPWDTRPHFKVTKLGVEHPNNQWKTVSS